MFGRSKVTSSTSATPVTQTGDGEGVSTGGKGRPTPKRKEQERLNRRPIGAPAVRPNATKEERQAAKAAQREQVRAERALTRQALATGDEKHLPARDQGPARRFTRDYVDSRHNAAEYFLPVALVAILMSVYRSPVTVIASMILLYGTVVVVVVDTFLLRRRVSRLAREKFGDQAAAGVAGYAMMRALQFRRGRLPRPQVERQPLFGKRG